MTKPLVIITFDILFFIPFWCLIVISCNEPSSKLITNCPYLLLVILSNSSCVTLWISVIEFPYEFSWKKWLLRLFQHFYNYYANSSIKYYAFFQLLIHLDKKKTKTIWCIYNQDIFIRSEKQTIICNNLLILLIQCSANIKTQDSSIIYMTEFLSLIKTTTYSSSI